MRKDSIRLADWSGFTDFGGSTTVYAPRNESEISSLVRQCYAHKKKLRVVGCQTAWNSLWHCQDVMISTKHLNAIKEINVEKHTVTCEAGVTLTELHKALWDKGLALDTAPAIDWVTVGGAISTGSHGSGPASISSSMIGCRLVMGNSQGEVVEIGEDDDRLDAVRVSVGMLGVLSTVTLRVVDAFYVSMKQTRIPTKEWARFLTEGEMSYALWFPHTEYTVLVRADVVPIPPESKGLHPGGFSEAAIDLDLKYNSFAKTSQDEALLQHYNNYSLPVSKVANLFPSTFPARNRYLLDVFFQDTEMTGPVTEMLMSFQSTPIAGAEWAVPVSRFDAALSDMQKEISQGDFYLPAPVYLKKVKGDSCWLSGANEESVQCGIYNAVIDGTPSHVKEIVMGVERIMLRHGGRPHLGKLIYLPPTDLKRMYPAWDKFNALRQQMDPLGIFWSEGIQKLFGDESH
jgi:L-gulonolactone oxidase